MWTGYLPYSNTLINIITHLWSSKDNCFSNIFKHKRQRWSCIWQRIRTVQHHKTVVLFVVFLKRNITVKVLYRKMIHRTKLSKRRKVLSKKRSTSFYFEEESEEENERNRTQGSPLYLQQSVSIRLRSCSRSPKVYRILLSYSIFSDLFLWLLQCISKIILIPIDSSVNLVGRLISRNSYIAKKETKMPLNLPGNTRNDVSKSASLSLCLQYILSWSWGYPRMRFSKAFFCGIRTRTRFSYDKKKI